MVESDVARAMFTATDADALRRFEAHLDALVARSDGLSPRDATDALAEVHSSIPSQLSRTGHDVVLCLLVRTACRLESAIASRRDTAAFARRLLSLCAADTGDTLRQQFAAYLQDVRAATADDLRPSGDPRVRMREARRHVASGVLSVKEIAASVGYSSVAAFSRQFKRSFGVSPRAWRHQAERA